MQKFESAWIEDRLKKIAAALIEAHREGNLDLLSLYAMRVPEIRKAPPKRQFMRLIQVFHPDRLAIYVRQVADCRMSGDEAGLKTLESLFEYQMPDNIAHASVRSTSGRRKDYGNVADYGFDETYGYDEDDFGYGEDDFEEREDDFEEMDGDFGESDPGETNPFAEGTFMDAIKREFFGNLELYPTRHEIEQFEGEMDLSDYLLDNLDGAEHCINLSSLNLAMNRIDNIWPLRDLTRLEYLDLSSNCLEDADELKGLTGLLELDLSFNEIEDVAFLLELPALKCVSLAGNPVRDPLIIERLRKRGVMVVL